MNSVKWTLLGLAGVIAAGGTFVAMALELKRKGRPTQYLSLSFNPATRLAVGREVFRRYRELKREEGAPLVLPWLVVIFAVVGISAMAVALMSLAS